LQVPPKFTQNRIFGLKIWQPCTRATSNSHFIVNYVEKTEEKAVPSMYILVSTAKMINLQPMVCSSMKTLLDVSAVLQA
jgi:hypothetical protein